MPSPAEQKPVTAQRWCTSPELIATSSAVFLVITDGRGADNVNKFSHRATSRGQLKSLVVFPQGAIARDARLELPEAHK
jgi:hypothetical protein